MSYHQMSLLGISNSYWGDLIKFGYVNRDRRHVANGDMRGEMPEWHPYQVVRIEIKRVFRIKDHIFCALPMHALYVLRIHIICVPFVPPFISSYQTHIIYSHASMCLLLKPIFYFLLLFSLLFWVIWVSHTRYTWNSCTSFRSHYVKPTFWGTEKETEKRKMQCE